VPPHISIRDVDFHPSTKGVRIRVWTDIACHLWCRLSEKEPWIHKKPSIRRGVPFVEDVRFCFTVYEDNEQHEPGDTLIHTFWKPDWPPCTTKWCYFWGYINGVLSVSSSPIFKYHNDGIDPLPTPRVLKTFTSIEPNFITSAGNGTWVNYSVKEQVDEDAVAVLLHVHYKSTTSTRWWGVRPTGAGGEWREVSIKLSQHWAIVKLDANKSFDISAQVINVIDVWLMGYFNSNIHMLDESVDRAPAGNGWLTIDFSDLVPATGVEALLLQYGTNLGYFPSGIRSFGSTDNRVTSNHCNYAIVKNNGGKVDYFKTQLDQLLNNRCALVGWFTGGAKFVDNGRDVTPIPLNVWTGRTLDTDYTHPSLVIVEENSTNILGILGIRKRYGDHSWFLNTFGGSHCLTHPDTNGMIEMKRDLATTTFWHLGSLD